MSKAIKRLLIGFAVTALVVIVTLPVAVPPIVASVAKSKIGEFGLKSSVRMSLGYCWRNGPGIEGELAVASRTHLGA